ncbi:Paraquat-inducible protein B [Labilithrix luteola]|uniref:Paraquat-inducible protein B n=1 Tax=Labilithrix luteola TaxID=1391654 RepID=A0A0K1PM44_9BACT|nr:MlaD family protein [Labilithrix luteola]AKU94608.1 Paraquat-inducible protein B [Labilithrix luteola]
MAATTNQYKLGLFVILGFLAAVTAAIALGALSSRKEKIVYYTYFNESVQGLDVGAPVKFRGVTIGHVSEIAVAPDHRQVEVAQEINVQDVERMGLTGEGFPTKRFLVPPDLRAQLGSQGITGVKYVSIDFFDPRVFPPPVLPFPPPANYIPAAPSLVKNLEDSVQKAIERLPELLDSITVVIGRANRILASFEDAGVSDHAASTFIRAEEVLAVLRSSILHIDQAHLGDRASETLTEAKAAVAKLNVLLEKFDGNEGILAAAQRTADSAAQLGNDARGTTRELESTLRDVGEAAQAIRSLAQALDRDPDILVKGRSQAKGKSP